MPGKKREQLIKKIFNGFPEREFEELVLEMFSYQSLHNKVYKNYLEYLGAGRLAVSTIADIPFMPVSLFKTHRVITGEGGRGPAFRSSGTVTGERSCHYVSDAGIYETSFLKCFEMFYGNPADYSILALLPSYVESGDSSLVYMVGSLIERSGHPESGFYLDDAGRLADMINKLENSNRKTLLIGVSFALLDLVDKYNFALKNTIVMETGGMKGRRREITREELHGILKSKTGLGNIHSEYGMTELLSQAYSQSDGIFTSPPWMRILIRDAYDPFAWLPPGRSGGVNIIDLANIDSCAFIETSDIGRMMDGGEFEILGRFDNSDIRGCNLLAD